MDVPEPGQELNWTVPAPTPTCHRCGRVLRNGYCMGCTPLPPVPDGLTARHAETSLSEGAESVVRGWKVLGDPIRPGTTKESSQSMPAYSARDQAAAKAELLSLVSGGMTIADGCRKIKRSRKTYENWRAADPEFAAKMDTVRVQVAKATNRSKDPDLYTLSFEAWRKFLGQDTYPHQRMWIDALEGREINPFHPAIKVKVGNQGSCSSTPRRSMPRARRSRRST